MEYPLAKKGTWYSHDDYETAGGQMIHMTPDEFLGTTTPLEMDDASRDNIDYLKDLMQKSHGLDPLNLYKRDPADFRSSDGRHRAHAAKELGIQSVPVLDFTKTKLAEQLERMKKLIK